MDPYDKEKTREIWKRVLGEEESCDCRAFDSELLREMIGREKTAVCLYRTLARCASGETKTQLLRFAEQTLCGVKKLEAVCYLWTGERSCVMSSELPRFCGLVEGLRLLYGCETEEAARLRRTAAELPDYGEVFEEVARESEGRAGGLMRLLRRAM